MTEILYIQDSCNGKRAFVFKASSKLPNRAIEHSQVEGFVKEQAAQGIEVIDNRSLKSRGKLRDVTEDYYNE